jgi:uncharacterized protein YidB (DUF937 family)
MGLLGSLLGGNNQQTGVGMSPITMALLGLLAYRTLHGQGPLGGVLGQGHASSTATPGTPAPAGPLGGLGDLFRGGLGGLLSGGAAGGLLSGGLNELVRHFQQNGYGEIAKPWVGTSYR